MRHGELLHRDAEVFGALVRDIRAGVGENQHEFLAAVSTDDVARADLRLEQTAQLAQHHVADIVPERVVELFEMVEIQHDDTEGPGTTLGASQFALEGFFEIAPIEQSGQRVADRLAAQRLAQLQIRHGEADLIGDGRRQSLLRFGPGAGGRRAEIQDSKRLALGEERKADVGRGQRLRQVTAEETSGRRVDDVHLPPAQCPALIRLEDRRVGGRRVAPGGPCLDDIARGARHKYPAGVLRKELADELTHHRIRLVLGGTGLEQPAHLIQEIELPRASRQALFRNPRVVIKSGVADGDAGLRRKRVEQLAVAIADPEWRRPQQNENAEQRALERNRRRVRARQPVRSEPLTASLARVTKDVRDVERAPVRRHPPRDPVIERKTTYRIVGIHTVVRDRA